MQGLPLLIFEAEDVASCLLEILHYWPKDDIFVSEMTQFPPIRIQMVDVNFSTETITDLFRHNLGLIFLYTKQRQTSTVCDHRFFINAPYGIFIEKMELIVSERERMQLAALLRPFVRRSAAVSDLSVAMARSLETYDTEQSKKRPLPKEWELVLREAEPISEGCEVCAICFDKKATICLVDCNTTAMCDDCVRGWGTQAALQHKCPFCRKTISSLKRPKI
jgi:hypothetical protein